MTAAAEHVHPPLAVSLATSREAAAPEVGAKAASLIRLKRAGLPVPDGFVLTTAFFASWTDQLGASPVWQAVCTPFDATATADRRRACDTAKRLVTTLTYSHEQRATLDAISQQLPGRVFAVRSSSPQEDLAHASFAGLYETLLDVSASGLADAVRACFASAFDERVLLYEQARGIAIDVPRLAVIVQAQVASEISGVAFSLNPTSNDFDQVVVNASWGLGDTLASGGLEPDTFVIDKVTGDVVERRHGHKGGNRPGEPCISDARLAQLTGLLETIECLLSCPVDVEWAFAASEAHILQARPITTHVPVPPELLTEPGAPRMVYMDAALSKGLTLDGAITPMTSSLMQRLVRLAAHAVLGSQDVHLDPRHGLFGPAGARWYLNLSNVLHLIDPRDRQTLVRIRQTDAAIADIFETQDLTAYRPSRPPEALRTLPLLWTAARVLWGLRGFLFAVAVRLLRRGSLIEHYQRATARFERAMAEAPDDGLSIDALLRHDYGQMAAVTGEATGPALILMVFFGTERLERLIEPGNATHRRLARAIKQGYSGDLVVEMGTLMYRISTLLSREDFADIDALASKLEHRALPAAFLDAWDEFMQRFGCRGPLEMELAVPRYADDPTIALRQIASLAASAGAFDPRNTQRRLIEARESAFAELREGLDGRKRRRLARAYRNIVDFAGTRDTPKHHLALINHRLRKRLLEEADRFVAAGRLDEPQQIFELTLDDVEAAIANPQLDLRARHSQRSRPYHEARQRVPHFPQMIDSRGRIVRPIRPAAPGELAGTAISPGVASGPVKILDDPFAKAVMPGDVLVAYTTDPGWTPLFINAAAVVLEIGGELQHGALVAREYGKPCVAGIDQVMTRLQDGQIVEVDGDSGVVRLVTARG
jgi:rifampicin phosphotransferase